MIQPTAAASKFSFHSRLPSVLTAREGLVLVGTRYAWREHTEEGLSLLTGFPNGRKKNSRPESV